MAMPCSIAVMWFNPYLECVYLDSTLPQSQILRHEIHTSKVELTHILQFVTGCPASPVTEFDTNLTIVFDHEEIQRKLSANTCFIKMPVFVG